MREYERNLRNVARSIVLAGLVAVVGCRSYGNKFSDDYFERNETLENLEYKRDERGPKSVEHLGVMAGKSLLESLLDEDEK